MSSNSEIDYTASASETPSYCVRKDVVGATEDSRIATQRSMVELGMQMANVVPKNGNHENNHNSNSYFQLEKDAKLFHFMMNFFKYDESKQREELYNLLSDNRNLSEENTEFKKLIEGLQRKFHLEEERANDMEKQNEEYIKELDEKDDQISDLENQIKLLQVGLESQRIKFETEINKLKIDFYKKMSDVNSSWKYLCVKAVAFTGVGLILYNEYVQFNLTEMLPFSNWF